MTKAIEDAANALAIRAALGVPTNAELAAVSDVADAAYVKPVDGIPHNDLHTGIRDQLDLADTALQPGVLPVGTTVTAAQISDAGAAGRTLLQKATLPEIQSLVSGGGRTLMSRIASLGADDLVLAVLGDSTGNESGLDPEWVRIMSDYIAANSSSHVRYQLYNDGAARYDSAVILADGGGEPYVTVGADNRGWGAPYSMTGGTTADIDAWVDCALTAWTGGNQPIISQYGGTGFRSWYMYVNTVGTPILSWIEEDGVTSRSATGTAALSLSPGQRKCVRAVLDADGATTAYTVKFYTSDDRVTWTQLGATVTGAAVTTVLLVTGQQIEIGARGGQNGASTAGAAAGAPGTYYAAYFSPTIGGANKLPQVIRQLSMFSGMSGMMSSGSAVHIYNGSIPGSNAAYIQAGDRLGRMLPNAPEINLFVNTSHNEDPVWYATAFIAGMLAYFANIRSRSKLVNAYVLTQNPQKPPRDVQRIVGQANRCALWPVLAMHPTINASVIDTYPLFAGNEASWIASDGIHPTTLGRQAIGACAIRAIGGAA